jgi:peptidoglycan/xylan/chitin deacetylase (PgdA/CDA1 family)
MSRRELLAKSMQVFGLTRLLECYRVKPGILIINHHRIGDAKQSRFDHGLFSATTDQLDQQMRYIKRHFPVAHGDELVELATARKPMKHLFVAVTFDDGYLDNYTKAFDVMRSNGCGGTFFLVPTWIGSNLIPWWDEVAHLVRNSPRSSFTLSYPVPVKVLLEGDRERAIHFVLQHYKRTDNIDNDEFMRQLRRASECDLPEVGRRFLDWQEAAEMQAGGMTIGSHTHTHRILAQLPEQQQALELAQSRAALEEKLGQTMTTLAYPVGLPTAFTGTTQDLATAAGYKLCFSFYGGVNTPQNLCATNLRRTNVPPDALMFRNQIAFMTRLDRLPYSY